MVYHVDNTVPHFAVAHEYLGERVHHRHGAPRVACRKAYYYIAVGHGFELQHAFLEVGGEVCVGIAVVDNAVEHNYLRKRVGHGVNVVVLGVVHRVDESLYGVIGGHEAGIVSACFEHVVHGGAFLARLCFLEQNKVLAQLGLRGYVIGGLLAGKDIQVGFVHLVGARQARKRHQYERKKQYDILSACIIRSFHGYIRLFKSKGTTHVAKIRIHILTTKKKDVIF